MRSGEAVGIIEPVSRSDHGGINKISKATESSKQSEKWKKMVRPGPVLAKLSRHVTTSSDHSARARVRHKNFFQFNGQQASVLWCFTLKPTKC